MRTRNCSRSWHLFGFQACIAALAVLAAASLARAEEATDAAAPNDLVRQALSDEIRGEDSQRSQALQSAIARAPQHAPARWHSGYVQAAGRNWVRYDEMSERLADDRRMARYRSRRDETPDTAAGQMDLANWCRRQKLAAQEQAHLARVLEHDAEHDAARARLGFVRSGQTWVRRAEIEEASRLAAAERDALAKWTPRLAGLADDLVSETPRRRAAGERRLEEIDDPAAVGALERVSVAGERPAMCIVEKLAQLPGEAATESLARHAVFAPWPAVRRAAAEYLGERSEDAYVPLLLAALHTPAEARSSVYTAADGRLVHVLAVRRESQDHRELAVFETAFDGTETDAGLEEADEEARERTADLAEDVARHNADARALNDRLTQALALATRAEGNLTPEDWWQWWTDHNEVYTPGHKPTVTRYGTDEVDVTPTPPPTPTTQDCLAAGTPVWTDRGPRPIDEVAVGDLVLSQHPDTGELAYKPVLRTTVRPPASLVRLTIDGGTLTASGGHPFWVSGRGWVRARELAVSDRLHGVDGTRLVEAVKPVGRDQTYNLIVADFNTYFAGQHLVLSHDNTIRQATEAIVPGLKRAE